MAVNSNVVLLFGPPFSGKSRYCQKHYVLEGFERLSPAEIFSSNPDLGLRDISVQIIKLLKKGKNVVIDDENCSVKTRRSYIQLISKKFPDIKLKLIKLCPKYGCLQCVWSREFVLASGCDPQQICKDHQIARWYDDPESTTFNKLHVDEPSSKEGFSISSKDTFLTALTAFKFEVTALFLQWEGISLKNCNNTETIISICKQWEAANPCGRIIIICDGQNISKGVLTAEEEDLSIKKVITQIVSEMPIPVYVIHLHRSTNSGSFCVPPNPSILAFLQKQHCLDLQCRTTVYLYYSSRHKSMAENAGIRHMKMERVLQNPKLVTSSCAAQIPAVPPMLQTLVLENDENKMSAEIPLYHLIDKFQNNFLVQDLPFGKREYLFAKDKTTIERFQILYATNATPLSERESRIEKLRTELTKKLFIHSTSLIQSESPSPSRGLPKWMLERQASSSASNLNKTGSSTQSKTRKRTVYMMTEKELVESAVEFLKQAGREDIILKIENERKVKCEERKREKECGKNKEDDKTVLSKAVGNLQTEKIDEVGNRELKVTEMNIETDLKEPSSQITLKRHHDDCDINTPNMKNNQIKVELVSQIYDKTDKHESGVIRSNMEDIGAMLDALFDTKIEPQRNECSKKKKMRLDPEDGVSAT